MSNSDLPRRTDVLAEKCPHCGSKNTVVELYDTTGPEGNCLSCSRSVPIPAGFIKDRLAPRFPEYRRHLR